MSGRPPWASHRRTAGSDTWTAGPPLLLSVAQSRGEQIAQHRWCSGGRQCAYTCIRTDQKLIHKTTSSINNRSRAKSRVPSRGPVRVSSRLTSTRHLQFPLRSPWFGTSHTSPAPFDLRKKCWSFFFPSSPSSLPCFSVNPCRLDFSQRLPLPPLCHFCLQAESFFRAFVVRSRERFYFSVFFFARRTREFAWNA